MTNKVRCLMAIMVLDSLVAINYLYNLRHKKARAKGSRHSFSSLSINKTNLKKKIQMKRR